MIAPQICFEKFYHEKKPKQEIVETTLLKLYLGAHRLVIDATPPWRAFFYYLSFMPCIEISLPFSFGLITSLGYYFFVLLKSWFAFVLIAILGPIISLVILSFGACRPQKEKWLQPKDILELSQGKYAPKKGSRLI